MADPPSSPAAPPDPNSQQSETDNPISQPDPSSGPTTNPPAAPQQQQSSTPPAPNPNPTLISAQPALIAAYAPSPISGAAVPPVVPSFRPVPQFSPLPNYQNPNVGVQPPGVTAAPVMASGAGAVPLPAPMMTYQVAPGQPPRPYVPLPNGYAAAPQGTMPPPGGSFLLFFLFLPLSLSLYMNFNL